MKVRTLGRVHRLLIEVGKGIHNKRKLSGVEFSAGHIQWALEHNLLEHKLGGEYHMSSAGWYVLEKLEQADPFPVDADGRLVIHPDDERWNVWTTVGEAPGLIVSGGQLSAKRGYKFVDVKVTLNKKWRRYFRNKRW